MQPPITERDRIAGRVRSAGFSCRRCGACCSGANNEVMVAPPEIEELVRATGLSAEDIVEPYPEWIEDGDMRFTFGWVLRRGPDGNCIFLEQNRCRVYAHRPHICRTYPCMLDGDALIVSECPGCIAGAETPDAEMIAEDLIRRRTAEENEARATEIQFRRYRNVSGSSLVFDSEGAHISAIPSKKS